MPITKRVRFSARARSQYGVTLLELLIVIAIVGVLGSLAYPSYVQYVVRTNRSAAKSMLLQVADRQEQFFGDNKQYTNDLADLGFSGNGFMINDKAAQVTDGAADRMYSITLTNVTATTFTANAAPQQRQATRDTDCATLTLTHIGEKGQTGASTDCW